ncbi:hypothetical protein V8D89_005892 [Ganoderma adspersum]
MLPDAALTRPIVLGGQQFQHPGLSSGHFRGVSDQHNGTSDPLSYHRLRYSHIFIHHHYYFMFLCLGFLHCRILFSMHQLQSSTLILVPMFSLAYIASRRILQLHCTYRFLAYFIVPSAFSAIIRCSNPLLSHTILML